MRGYVKNRRNPGVHKKSLQMDVRPREEVNK